jgi:signal transduction histidine kinase
LIKSYNKSFQNIYETDRYFEKISPEICKKTTLIQVFSGIVSKNIIIDIQQSVRLYFPNAFLIGATTDGEIVEGVVKKESISISITTFEKSFLFGFGLENRDNFLSGQRIAKNLIKERTKVLIIFSDGLYTNGEELLNGVASISNKVVVAGGMAGDNGELKKTFVFNEKEIFSQGAVAVSISGVELFVHNQSNFGWLPFGEKLRITKADQNIVYSIENILPVKIYEKYLGKDIANKLPLVGIEFPLIKVTGNNKIARAILGKFEDGTLQFAGNLNEGDIVQIGLGDLDTILNLSKESLLNYINKPVETTFIYSCMARRRFLKENISLEIKPFNKISDNSGFFTNGEFFSSRNQDGTFKYELLNQSMTILSISEDNNKIVNKSDITSQIQNFDKTLSHTTKAISHLTNVVLKDIEKEVNEKRALAFQLEADIKEEMRKNREKDEILVTEYKLARIGELMGMIAHQWRQPLASIAAISSSCRLKFALDKFDLETSYGREEMFSFFNTTLSKIEANVEFLSNTIDDFRKFYRDNDSMEAITVKEVLEHTLSLVDDKSIDFLFDCDNHLKMEAYSNQLIQVVLNIIKNSSDVFKERSIKNRKIFFSCREDEDKKFLDIQDNGGGISNEVLPFIFEKNFSTKPTNNGMGLGLYMSKLIIEEKCKGKISVKNIDDGANFRIEFYKRILK